MRRLYRRDMQIARVLHVWGCAALHVRCLIQLSTTITTAGRISSSSAFSFVGQPWWPTQTPTTANVREVDSEFKSLLGRLIITRMGTWQHIKYPK